MTAPVGIVLGSSGVQHGVLADGLQILHHGPDPAGTGRCAEAAANAAMFIYAELDGSIGMLVTGNGILSADVDTDVAVPTGAAGDAAI